MSFSWSNHNELDRAPCRRTAPISRRSCHGAAACGTQGSFDTRTRCHTPYTRGPSSSCVLTNVPSCYWLTRIPFDSRDSGSDTSSRAASHVHLTHPSSQSLACICSTRNSQTICPSRHASMARLKLQCCRPKNKTQTSVRWHSDHLTPSNWIIVSLIKSSGVHRGIIQPEDLLPGSLRQLTNGIIFVRFLYIAVYNWMTCDVYLLGGYR